MLVRYNNNHIVDSYYDNTIEHLQIRLEQLKYKKPRFSNPISTSHLCISPSVKSITIHFNDGSFQEIENNDGKCYFIILDEESDDNHNSVEL